MLLGNRRNCRCPITGIEYNYRLWIDCDQLVEQRGATASAVAASRAAFTALGSQPTHAVQGRVLTRAMSFTGVVGLKLHVAAVEIAGSSEHAR